MAYGTLVLPAERARHYIEIIGTEALNVQFEDMNARCMQRPYKRAIQKLDEMERLLRFLTEELMKVPGSNLISNNVDSFLDAASQYTLDDMEMNLKRIHRDFVQFKENCAKLTEGRNSCLERILVADIAMQSMGHYHAPLGNQIDAADNDVSQSLLDAQSSGAATFSTIAGVIPQGDKDRFARALFRATRGNTYTYFKEILPMMDPQLGRDVHKAVFVVYFADVRSIGGASSAMSELINRICGLFDIHRYPWPSSVEDAQEMKIGSEVQAEDHLRLLREHENFVRNEAASLLEPARPGGNSIIEDWRLFCKKEKAIYAALNQFEGQELLRANCWFPEKETETIRLTLQNSSGNQACCAMLVSHRAPPRKARPTFFRKNDFTAPFHELVDTYGLPRYGEANPMLFTTFTFPFLFAVMWGDIGHGLMLIAVGLCAVRYADTIKYTLPSIYMARYLLVMMGFFATYVGLLYNDFFSVGLNLFESRWASSGVARGGTVVFTPTYDVRNEGGDGPYPFGVDPAWHGAQNELLFMNSMKMKISVIFGVAQMVLGLLLRLSNVLHERNWLDLVCEFVPMLVFMLCFFGFMDYMIMYKWVTAIPDSPSIINSLIQMGMWGADPKAMLGETLPRLLMLICMLTVPVMLIPKPWVLKRRHKKKQERLTRARNAEFASARALSNSASSSFARPSAPPGAAVPLQDMSNKVDEESLSFLPSEGVLEEDSEEFEFGEVVIHQVIETIEYVLGTVSHTASYLRLWALSLAHQQLSVVFFDMILLNCMAMMFPLNVITTAYGFIVWLLVTVTVLLGMDLLEAFLHTLRLHWVEFQSKFYRADGYAFTPFRIRTLLQDNEV
eukprot:TRINITY_DN54611_c0_g1_i1.p1 TRINITY_DN54611_c0_g1~~TRINITY_DN54611_c0_g1_i1.p1  ORF type:complete len:880 (+),score=156.44 TRINITY_DN54611_c0_g1_i1:108-2642(+)